MELISVQTRNTVRDPAQISSADVWFNISIKVFLAPQDIVISELMKKLDILGDNAVSVCWFHM